MILAKLGAKIVGFGLWLATPRSARPNLKLSHGERGKVAIRILNAQGERDELARRQAKPSTRKRVR